MAVSERPIMNSAVAIVGMSCRYPDARSPDGLRERVLGRRWAFCRMPRERLNLEDFRSADRENSGSIYSTEAALIEGYEFDREKYCIAHWTRVARRCTDYYRRPEQLSSWGQVSTCGFCLTTGFRGPLT